LAAVSLLYLQFLAAMHLFSLSESSQQVSNITYTGLHEHRIIEYTATGQKTNSKERMSTETTATGQSSKTPEAQHAEVKQI
jgi:hypothetical protein